MRHKRKNAHYGMEQRGRHDIRNLTASLFLYEKVVTTPLKAKRLKSITDKMINLGKKGTTTSIRKLNAYFWDKNVSKKIVEDLVPKFKTKTSGYTRVVKMGNRPGDGAPRYMVELLVPHKEKKAEKEAPKAKAKVKVKKVEEKPTGWFERMKNAGKKVEGSGTKVTTRTTSK